VARKLALLHAGQSNDEPYGDYASFAARHAELDVLSATLFPSTTSIGAYGDKFTIPGNIPGFTNPVDIRARALNKVRFLTHYNPLCTGYKTYPCVGRTRTGTTGEPTLVVEQTFQAAAVTGGIVLTRFRDRSTHKIVVCTPNAAGATIKIVPTAAKTLSASNTGTDTLTLNAAHGWLADTQVRLVATTGATLPIGTGIAEGTTLFVRSPNGADLQLAATAGGAAIDIGTAHSGTVYIYAVKDSWRSAEVGEQFDYTLAGITAVTNVANGVVLPLGFGNIRDGTLLGLKLTCISGTAGNVNVSRIITGYNNRLREAELDSAFPQAIAATDQFVITPQSGTFDKFALFLPWSPLEAGNTSGKVSPWPPGFNYPNHYHVPQNYRWDAGVGQGLIALQMNYAVPLAVRLQETLGEEILVIGGGVGATSLSRSELAIAENVDIGWFDPKQMSCWAPGEENNCFQRLCDNVDAAIAALAAEGHTLEIALVTFMQGETDGFDEIAAENYFDNSETFFRALRAFLKSRGVWPRSEESIPIVQPQILDVEYGGAWPFSKTINVAKRRLAAKDRFMRAPVTNGFATTGVHYSGRGMSDLAQRISEEFIDLLAANDPTGEVEICNAALSLIGDASKVTSIDPPDGSSQAALCARFYAQARDSVLEAGQWSFAMRRVDGEPLDSPSTNWAFAYRRPGDAIKIVAVLPADIGDDYPTLGAQPLVQRETMTQFLTTGASTTSGLSQAYQFQQENVREGVILLSNVESAVIRYVARVTDTRQFTSSQFVEALQYRLASLIVGATATGVEGRAEAKRLLEASIALTRQAGGVDIAQQQIKPQRIAPWHRNR